MELTLIKVITNYKCKNSRYLNENFYTSNYILVDRGFLDDVKLETAHRGAAGESADWVEHCKCPTGYVGQFCESCAPGFHHDPPNGGPFALCVSCNCNGHADICEAETGIYLKEYVY